MQTITREDARENGLVWYFTGKPCRSGHTDKRYTKSGICYSCNRKNCNRDYHVHKERRVKDQRKHYREHRSARILAAQIWAEKNRQRSNATKAKWKKKHRQQYLRLERKYAKKRRKDPIYRLSAAISRAIWSWLKGNKDYRHWENMVGFTAQELKAHLEKQFTPKMSWDNYGSYWHVDHITPQSWTRNFKETWSLNNLQPLEATKNLSKGNRYKG